MILFNHRKCLKYYHARKERFCWKI